MYFWPCGLLFLSTLSLRRATINTYHRIFGEGISIHALLAESDIGYPVNLHPKTGFLSTLSLRRATSPIDVLAVSALPISIHALLAESDVNGDVLSSSLSNFYPRSPCGERLKFVNLRVVDGSFLSTLSLRRATARRASRQQPAGISIHALLAESDLAGPSGPAISFNFYPRSPCGERQHAYQLVLWVLRFLSTLSLRRATAKVHKTVGHFCAYETNFMGIASSC